MDREEKLRFYKALIVPAYLDGAKTALKHWERWRMQPEKTLIAHIKKLAEENAEQTMVRMEERQKEVSKINNYAESEGSNEKI